MTLGDCQKQTHNNFDVLRLVFALAVLFAHSFPISAPGAEDPLSPLMRGREWLGGIAVHGFFAISGFLVTASFMRRGAASFLASRALRLYPAVLVFCLVSVLVIGPIAARVPLAQYFAAEPWQFFRNAPLWEWNRNIPYAFRDHPFPGSFNGSSWTLPIEVRCYLLILVLGLAGAFRSRLVANLVFSAVMLLAAWFPANVPLLDGEERSINSLVYFCAGALYWINREGVSLGWKTAAAMAAVLVFAWNFGGKHYLLLSVMSVTYWILLVVYRTPALSLDRFGDVSFGVYLYAWPLQQLVWRPGQSPYLNALLATALVVPVAWLSWRYVEAPALRLRKLTFGAGWAFRPSRKTGACAGR